MLTAPASSLSGRADADCRRASTSFNLIRAHAAWIPRYRKGQSRTSERRQWCAPLALTISCAALTIGCELSTNLGEAARELADPGAETIESGGRLVAEGHYRRLRFDGTAADGAFVIAIKDGEELEIVPFLGDDPACSAGPAYRFSESLSRTDDNDVKLDARIPFTAPHEDDDRQTLRFTNFACDVDPVEVVGGDLPLSSDFAKAEGVLVQDDQDQIYLVNPWSGEKELIAEETRSIRSGDHAYFDLGADDADWMWTIEAGEVVARNRDLKRVFRAGQDVSSFYHSKSGAGGPMVAMRDSEGTLSTVLASDPDSLTTIAKDTCSVRFSSGMAGRELLYFSPCEERTLRVTELETGTTRTVRSGIEDYNIAGATETGPIVLYVTDIPEDADAGTIWARWGQNEPIKVGEQALLRLSSLKSDGAVRVVVDWDGTGGTLMMGQLGEKLEEKARSVAYYSSAGVIADFDGLNGTLMHLTDDQELVRVADNISINGVRNDRQKDRALFLSDYDGTDGQLTLVEGDRVRRMSQNVRPSSYQFTALLPMVTLLSDLDEETNTAVLKLHRTERDEELIVAEGVAESVEVNWPTEGLLYSAPAGEPPGIYFARAE